MLNEESEMSELPIDVAPAQINPKDHKSVHPDVLKRGIDDPLNVVNVKQWIKHNREKIKTERYNVRIGTKGAEARLASLEGFVRNLNNYLNSGIYNDMFYGEEQQSQVNYVCIAPAYDKNGNMKRTIGVWYRDIADVWTKEMDAEYRKANFNG
jgi:hypothetical protein